MRVLVVTAVTAEADAVAEGLVSGLDGLLPTPPRSLPGGYLVTGHTRAGGNTPRSSAAGEPMVDVMAGGVGPASVAAATATALAVHHPLRYDLVVSAGIAGGFPSRAPLGSLVVADAIIAADLGADSADGFVPVDELGFGRAVHLPPPELTASMTRVLAAGPATRVVLAPILTVSTVTGTAARADELASRHPRAAAEAMEGFGVAEAAAAYRVPCAEIRAVSNAVGPRDRGLWRVGRALDCLRQAFTLVTPVFEEP